MLICSGLTDDRASCPSSNHSSLLSKLPNCLLIRLIFSAAWIIYFHCNWSEVIVTHQAAASFYTDVHANTDSFSHYSIWQLIGRRTPSVSFTSCVSILFSNSGCEFVALAYRRFSPVHVSLTPHKVQITSVAPEPEATRELINQSACRPLTIQSHLNSIRPLRAEEKPPHKPVFISSWFHNMRSGDLRPFLWDQVLIILMNNELNCFC